MGVSSATLMAGMTNLTVLKIAGGIAVIVSIGFVSWAMSLYKKVEPGKALIIAKMQRIQVTFTGTFVIPVIHRAETMDIGTKVIEIDCRGKNGLICKDNIRADVTANFHIRVNKTPEDVLRVADMLGCERASDIEILKDLFRSKFDDALRTLAIHKDFEEFHATRETLEEQIFQQVGCDLNGVLLESVVISHLEQTPVECLDENNVFDARGIRKILQNNGRGGES